MNFILADNSDEPQLRRLQAELVMPGHISMIYEREPDFFAGLNIQGEFNQVIVAKESDRTLGFGCRSVRPMYINGTARNFGYLSTLRSTPEAKKRMGLHRAYQVLKKLHADNRCRGYITTIIDGNIEALRTIASGRAGMPYYKYLGECLTYAIPLNRRKRRIHDNISVRFAKATEAATIAHLLAQFGSRLQFFPAISKRSFNTPLLRDLPVTDFMIAERDGVAVGTAAIWNQSNFKQHRIATYSRSMQLAKPFINSALRVTGYHPLPACGEQIKSVFFCFKAAKDNDPKIISAMLKYACNSLRQKEFSHCITGFHSLDPARHIISNPLATIYRSHIFFTGWENDLPVFEALDKRTICFEPAIM